MGHEVVKGVCTPVLVDASSPEHVLVRSAETGAPVEWREVREGSWHFEEDCGKQGAFPDYLEDVTVTAPVVETASVPPVEVEPNPVPTPDPQDERPVDPDRWPSMPPKPPPVSKSDKRAIKRSTAKKR
jgi:hypothetical protein